MKTYTYKFSKDFEKFLKKRSQKFILSFEKKLNVLVINPFDNNLSLDIEKVKWFKNHYRLRIGKYRLLYTIIKNEILIYFYHAGNRWSVYNKI